MTEKSNTQRFTNRVENYIKYRPAYPASIFPYLAQNVGLRSKHAVADVGAGTGIFTRQLVDYGCRVFAVEPNAAMRKAAESELQGAANFSMSAGTAESTLLADRSVDFVVAAQAYHWFDRDKAKREFRRILRPGGVVVLLWNVQNFKIPFMQAQEEIVKRHATDYINVARKEKTAEEQDADLEKFFSPGRVRRAEFVNEQVFDFDGLVGRALSSSYAPTKEHANYSGLIGDLKQLFDAHQQDGSVVYRYITQLYYATTL